MALHGLFSIYDSAAKTYTPPVVAATTEVGVRMFSSLVANGSSLYAKHPEDFTLFHLGEMDDEDGSLLALETPVRVIGAWELEVVAQHQDNDEREALLRALPQE